MSTFESSSSFAAPAAARSISTRASGLRKTHNRNALTINTTPTDHTKPYFEVDSDEEEERIRVALVPVVDEQQQHYYSWRSESDEVNNNNDNNAINVTIQFGWIGTVRNAFARVKKNLVLVTAEKNHRRVLSAITIFALFFLVVMFGGSVTAANTMASASTGGIGIIAPPSGRSMRIVPEVRTIPIWSPPPANANANVNNNNGQQDSVPSPSRQPPSSVVGRAARAASVTRRSMSPSEPVQEGGPVPISPSFPRVHVDAPDFVVPVNPPYGTMSAKFRLLYVYKGQQLQPQVGREPEKREHDHPENLAALFNGGRL
jgi:hypothetical protein